jgi:hypothetical protein
MRKIFWSAAVTALGLGLVVAGAAVARSEANRVQVAAALSVREEVPAPTGDVSGARGSFTATVTRSGAGATLGWRLTFSGLTGPAIAAHVHTGARGEPGPVSVPLCGPCDSGATGTANIDATVLAAIQGGRAYVNVHTGTNRGGEIRGQLSAVASTRTVLNARQEVPRPQGNVRRARGLFTVAATKSGTIAVVAWRLTFSGLTGPALAAHIHLGPRGRAGRVAAPLCAPCRSGARGRVTVRGGVLSALEAGRAYVNVHTRRNPAGEIRGQLGAVPLTVTP